MDLNNDLLHTPDGMRDTYGKEMAKKSDIMNRIRNRIRLYGYEEIQTPTIEFYDVFSSEVGTKPVRELYKLLDNEGNLLVLRPDFTPSVARCAAKYFYDEASPIRFTYAGSVFGNTSSLQGKLSETIQMGAELINAPSVNADAEILALLIDSLLQTGLTQFQISVGNVDYFKGICQAVGLDQQTETQLRDRLSGKNYFAAEELLRGQGFDRATRDLFLKATRFVSTREELSQFLTPDMHPQARGAIERLMELCDLIEAFKGYTYGAGEAIASGGRYDGLLSYYGKSAAAIGVMIQLDLLMEALRRQGIAVETAPAPQKLAFSDGDAVTQIRRAMELRSQGHAVILQ